MIQSAVLRAMKGWSSRGAPKYCLGVDVGGSGLRIQLSNRNDPAQKLDHPHIRARSATDFYKVFSTLDSEIQKQFPGAKCVGSAFALAGMRKGDTVEVMNWPAGDRMVHMDKIPAAVNQPGTSVLLNDLESCAYGIVSCKDNGTENEYFEQICGPKGASVVSNGNTAIMAMGSGLGGAFVVRERETRVPLVISAEPGWLLSAHLGPCHEQYAENSGILRLGSMEDTKGRWAPKYEDMASGHGLVMDYEFLLGKKVNLTGVDIAEKAKAGDATARRAMVMHYIYFTKCAKNWAMPMKCDSIVMALSNQVTNRWLVQQIKEEMEKELHDSTRPEWTKDIAIFAQMKECNFNIVGTTYMAQRVAK